MLTDAHCHPFDLQKVFPGMEEERRRLGVLCAASAADREEFEYNEALAQKAKGEGAAAVLPCFAVHPQMPVKCINGECAKLDDSVTGGLDFLAEMAAQGRLAAVGETGFDLFGPYYRETEAIQDVIFKFHLDIAQRYDLPLVLHVRRAMHKVFAAAVSLKKCRAVIFHSWPGTVNEGEALLKRGINAFFSFGTPIMLNHREAMRSCAVFPAERLLTETDAPYQPLHKISRSYSAWSDLPLILETLAALRREAGTSCADADELEKTLGKTLGETIEETIEKNFRLAFGDSFFHNQA